MQKEIVGVWRTKIIYVNKVSLHKIYQFESRTNSYLVTVVANDIGTTEIIKK